MRIDVPYIEVRNCSNKACNGRFLASGFCNGRSQYCKDGAIIAYNAEGWQLLATAERDLFTVSSQASSPPLGRWLQQNGDGFLDVHASRRQPTFVPAFYLSTIFYAWSWALPLLASAGVPSRRNTQAPYLYALMAVLVCNHWTSKIPLTSAADIAALVSAAGRLLHLPALSRWTILIAAHQLWVPTLIDAFVTAFLSQFTDASDLDATLRNALLHIGSLTVPAEEACLVPPLARFHAGAAGRDTVAHWLDKSPLDLQRAARIASELFDNDGCNLVVTQADGFCQALRKLRSVGRYISAHCCRSLATAGGKIIKAESSWGCMAMSDKTVRPMLCLLGQPTPSQVAASMKTPWAADIGCQVLVFCESMQVHQWASRARIPDRELLCFLQNNRSIRESIAFEAALPKVQRAWNTHA